MNTNSTGQEMPIAVLKAIDHVRQFHSEVDMVAFNDMGRWQFMSEDFERVKFGSFDRDTGLYGGIDVGILDEAANAAYSDLGHPCAYQAYTSENYYKEQ